MKQHGCFVLMLALLMSRSLAAEGPQVTITNEGGVPQIQIAETGPSCPTHPIDDGLRQRIIDVAAHEWAEFDFPRLSLRPLVGYNVLPPGISPDQRKTRASGGFVARVLPVGAMEDDAAVRMHIGRYWASTPQAERVFRRQNETWSASRGRAGWTEYWSAAFVSYVMCMAGLKNEEFGRSGSHVSYIRAAVEMRDGLRSGYAYTAYDIIEITPAPGDIICAARDDPDHSIDRLSDFRQNPNHNSYHCDIIVGFDNRRPRLAGVAYAIGGNVINSVSLTETPIGNGHLIKVRSPHGRNWFTVLRLTAAAGQASFRNIPKEILERAHARAKEWLNTR
jgi:hypothetical protein